MDGTTVWQNFERGHSKTIPTKFSLIWFSSFREKYLIRALQFIPAPTSSWLVRKHFLLANKSMLLARLIKIPIRTIQLHNYILINNVLNETEDVQLRNGLLLILYINICMFQTFIMINKTFMFKLFLSCNKFGLASNIWACIFANITYIMLLLE